MLRLWTAALCLSTLLALSGCAARTPAPEYFRLVLPSAGAASDLANFSLAVGPVTIPERLDRNGILIPDSAARITHSEHYRWSEPLDDALAQELAWALGERAPALDVFVFPWPSGATPKLQVSLQLSRFEAVEPHQLELAGLLTLSDRVAEQPLATRRFAIAETVREPGVSGLVAAHGRAAARLVEEILELLERQHEIGDDTPET